MNNEKLMVGKPTHPCHHDSTRHGGALDDHCLLCGKEGYWRDGQEVATVEIHPSGKVLLSLTETTEGLVRVELTREEAEAFWNDLCFVDPDSKEDVAPECWSAWQKVRAGWGPKARAALADEGAG